MSASDSDNSIDWLASDDEDNESESGLDCSTRPTHQNHPSPSTPSSPDRLGRSDASLRYGGGQKEDSSDGSSWGGSSEDSGQGSPGSCTMESWSGHTGVGLCPTADLERSPGTRTQQAHKRPRSPSVTEHKERPLNSSPSEKSRLFANKCMELQCYIHPLSSILNGLRTGRYRERLSSFQESVAMDRIQRIMGVLQNPCMGERYFNIIVKMEEMLKSWFPNVKPRDQHTVAQTEETSPTKRAKLLVSTTVLPGAAVSPFTTSAPFPAAKAQRVTDLSPSGASNTKWLHSAPLGALAADHGDQGGGASLATSRALTQDSAISSSTDGSRGGGAKTDSAPGRPSPAKINAPCLERLLKSTESIIGHKGAMAGSSYS